MRRTHFLIILILLVSTACIVGTPTAAPTQPPQPERPTPTDLPPATETTPPTEAGETPAVTADTPTSPAPTQAIAPEVAMQMNAIQAQVIDLRGLQPTGDIPRALLSPDELRQRVINDFLADYTPEESAEDVIELAALGLLEPGFDLNAFYIELLSEQVAGYYDNEAGEMFVVQGSGFFGPERLTYAHEYTHVLQDQTYDIENGLDYNDEACEIDTERCAAIQALIEGDATLSELNWFYQFSTADDQQQIMDFYATYESPVFDSAPPFMTQDFTFPYVQGYAFVETLYNQGGFDAVDAAYANLPVSTEQILHPERYPADAPVPVEMPDLLLVLGDGWRELDRIVMGEWYTYLILGYSIEPAAQLEDSMAAAAAAGWGGDTYVVYYNDATAQTVLVMRTIWETPTDANQFADAFGTYAEARFGVLTRGTTSDRTWDFDGGFAEMTLSGTETLWILAPDPVTARFILQAVQGQ